MKPAYKNKYDIGDIVKIKELKSCVFGFVPDMIKFVGKTVTISELFWVSRYNAWCYTISEDNLCWWWSEECFEVY